MRVRDVERETPGGKNQKGKVVYFSTTQEGVNLFFVSLLSVFKALHRTFNFGVKKNLH